MTEPFYFGAGGRQLFGVYHAPEADAPRAAGLALCPPLGQEYIRSHRAYVQLARLLAARGLHVLRFDLSCCGDSPGDADQGRFAQWVGDAGAAAAELRNGALQQVGLVGLRLGATVALMAGAKRRDIAAMVLWEPVVSGGAYVAQLRSLHRTWLRASFARALSDRGPTPTGEVLGFPLTAALMGELQAVDAFALDRKPADKVLVIETARPRAGRRLCQYLAQLGTEARCEHIPGPDLWIRKENPQQRGVVPSATLQRIAQWLAEVLS
jgi:pimeloyl-ACP methyl ester carboxylesterase